MSKTTRYGNPPVTVQLGVNLGLGNPTVPSVEVRLHRDAQRARVTILRNGINTNLPTWDFSAGAASARHSIPGDVIEFSPSTLSVDWDTVTPEQIMQHVTGRTDWEIVVA